MNCDSVKEAVNDLIDGRGSDSCDSSLFQHLAECPDCSGFFKVTTGIKNEIKNEQFAFPNELNEKVFERIRNEQIKKKIPFSFNILWKKNLSIPLPIGIAFSMILIILSVLVFQTALYKDRTNLSNLQFQQITASPEKIIILYGMPEITIKDQPFENTSGTYKNNLKIQ